MRDTAGHGAPEARRGSQGCCGGHDPAPGSRGESGADGATWLAAEVAAGAISSGFWVCVDRDHAPTGDPWGYGAVAQVLFRWAVH